MRKNDFLGRTAISRAIKLVFLKIGLADFVSTADGTIGRAGILVFVMRAGAIAAGSETVGGANCRVFVGVASIIAAILGFALHRSAVRRATGFGFVSRAQPVAAK